MKIQMRKPSGVLALCAIQVMVLSTFMVGAQAQTTPPAKKTPAPAPAKPAVQAAKPVQQTAHPTSTTTTRPPTSGTTTAGATTRPTTTTGTAVRTTPSGSGITTSNAGTRAGATGSGITTTNAGTATGTRTGATGATTTTGTNRNGTGGASTHPGTGTAAAGTTAAGVNGSRPVGTGTAGTRSNGTAAGVRGAEPRPAAAEIARRGPMGGRPAPVGARDVHTAHADVRMRADGRPMDIHDPHRGLDIHNNLGGGHRAIMDRPGGGRMYVERGRPGYIGHPYQVHGYEFNRRVYYDHGRAYNRFYRPYAYHGYAFDVYVPNHYYGPAFYGWAYNPWREPVSYSWGFSRARWYGYYGGYYTPYPVYSSPSLWLTDYMISQSLAAAYTAQVDSGAPPQGAYAGQPLSPEVKQMVADEVQHDLALENAEAQANAQQQAPDPASSGVVRLLSDGQPHVFVASREVDVTDQNGQECAVTDGDVVLLKDSPGPSDTTANVTVLASKGGKECARSAQVAIGLDELNEMNNHLRETLDRGLAELQTKQGTGGLPAEPPSAKDPGVDALVAQGAPPPEPDGARELEAFAKQSDTAEQELVAEVHVGAAAPDGGDGVAQGNPLAASGPSVSLQPGASMSQVKEAMGAPTKVVNLGKKTIYFYGDTKVTMVDGVVKTIE